MSKCFISEIARRKLVIIRGQGVKIKNWNLSTTKTFCSFMIIAGSFGYFFPVHFRMCLFWRRLHRYSEFALSMNFSLLSVIFVYSVSSFRWNLKCHFYSLFRQRLVLFITAFQFSKDRYFLLLSLININTQTSRPVLNPGSWLAVRGVLMAYNGRFPYVDHFFFRVILSLHSCTI